jgi:ApaG protein
MRPRHIEIMFSETTANITVTVRPVFVPEQSKPAEDKYVWAYKVRIENRGSDTVQLRNRHWKITDARGKLEEVKGPGVVGEQPVLKPGESFEYTSGCPLRTPSGFMVGTYEMERADGTRFEVRVPMFSLDSPHAAQRIH